MQSKQIRFLTIAFATFLIGQTTGTSHAQSPGAAFDFRAEAKELERRPSSSQQKATEAETDPNDTSATATPLTFTPTAIANATINPGGDVDFYTFTAPAGARVWIETDTGGVQNAGATSRDTVIDLFEADGTTVIENDDDDGVGNGSDGTIETGLSSTIAGRTLTTGGTYFIRVQAFSATAIINPYRLFVSLSNVAATAEVEANGTAATANVANSPALRSGAIDVGADEDYYSVSANAGDTIFFAVDGDPARTGTGTDLVVEFRDPADAILLTIDSSVVGSLANPAAEGANFTVNAAGTYFIKVRHVSAVGTGTYDIHIVSTPAATSPLLISDFRVRGPSGANDEYVEIYNDSDTDTTVASQVGSGFAIAASDATVRCTIPNGTVIPGRGHYLCTNSVAYSLGGYAAGDATFTTDIADNAGIALFNNNVPVNFILANRLDAVGSTSEANTLYKEGAGYPALTPFSIDYSFVRDDCGKQGGITTPGACPFGGLPGDSDDNAVDFYFVDTNGTSAGAGQRLGAPGPQNLASQIHRGAEQAATALDTCVAQDATPNLERDLTSVPAQNSTFGTIDLRYTFTNTTGAPITALRFRLVDQTTFPAPSGTADLRARTSSTTVVNVDRPPCDASSAPTTVEGTTLEQPPSQPNGSAFNGSMSVPAITLGTPLATGASVDLRFLFGVQQTGSYRIGLVPEGLPQAGTGDVILFECTTDPGGCAPPAVSSIARVDPNPTNAAVVNYTVTFNRAVTGVDAGDFVLTTTGLAGMSVGAVTGAGATRNVEVNVGTGTGTLRLDLVDDDSIIDTTFSKPLAGAGAGNGDFDGEVYDIDTAGPTVTVEQAAGQLDPTAASPINFTVTFDEAVADFIDADVTLGGTAGATTAVVTGGPTAYNVAVSGMTTNGTVTAALAAGVASDALGNPSAASTSVDNTVTFGGFDLTSPTVTIEQAVGQLDPTATSPINFTVTFSESVSNFATGDVTLGGTAGATTALVTGGPTVYNVAVSGMTTNGSVVASLAAGIASDAGGNPSAASTSTDNAVDFGGLDLTPPTVTIDQAVGQVDPAATSPINFTVTFSEPVADFATGDVTLGGTAGATTAVVTGGPTVYNVAVSGMTANGSVTAALAAGIASDAAGNPSAASTSADNAVDFEGLDATAPTVTIDQAVGQADPTSASPIDFTVTFSESVADFTTGDVTLGGTAGATTAVVTGGPTVYNVAVTGMGASGTVIASIGAGVATDASDNLNAASTSTDNAVVFELVVVAPPSIPAVIPTLSSAMLALLGLILVFMTWMQFRQRSN